MRITAMIGSMVFLFAAACSDGGSEDTSPLEAEINAWKISQSAMVESYCVCAGDAASDLCQKSPEECYADVAACKVGVPVGPIDCYAEALMLDEEGSLVVAQCYVAASTALNACFAKVNACEAPALNACSSDYDAATRACPELPEAVVAAYAKCK